MTVTLIAAVDRRRPNRVSPPACPLCGTDEAVTVLSRTPTFVYFRCEACRELLPARVPRPAGEQTLAERAVQDL